MSDESSSKQATAETSSPASVSKSLPMSFTEQPRTSSQKSSPYGTSMTESEFDREKSVQIGHDLDLLADDKYGQHASVDEGEQTEKIQPQDLQAAAIQENIQEENRKAQTRKRANTAKISIGVNEEKMIEDHASYHRAITGEEGEKRLKKHGGNCYLTRYSESQECYILTVYEPSSNPVKKHFAIEKSDTGEHKIRGKSMTFSGIQQLLEYYEQNTIDPALRSIGKAYTEEEYKRSSGKCEIL